MTDQNLEAKSESRKLRTPEEAQKIKNRKKEREGNKSKGKETKIRHEQRNQRIYLKDYTISGETEQLAREYLVPFLELKAHSSG